MKTLLLIITLTIQLSCFAQETDSSYMFMSDSHIVAYHPKDSEGSFTDEYVPFVVGSDEVLGYEVETRTCDKEDVIILPNGRCVAGLGTIIKQKEEYLNGYLIFDGDTTTITDVKIEPVDDGAKFYVVGKDFEMSFTLLNGFILELEDRKASFYTRDKGIWTINKK